MTPTATHVPSLHADVLQTLFGPMPLAQRQWLGGIAQAHPMVSGELVFNTRQPLRQVWAVQDGAVLLGHVTPEGGWCTEHTLTGPAWVDAASGWLGEAPPLAARCRDDCRMLSWPCAVLEAGIVAQPGLGRRLVELLARQCRQQAQDAHERIHLGASARFAQWLQRQLGSDPGPPVLRLRQRKRDLAAQLGITPETLSRLMRAMKQEGVIDVAGYTLRVLDIQGLARQAQAG
ncbi:MAG: Crp/Fnr family transcriptional regulator [Aquabacterium sp.]